MADTEGLIKLIRAALSDIAPESEALTLRVDKPLRQQLELDSVDWLNFLLNLHRSTGVDIPESDYAKLTTLAAIANYLQSKQR